jgi:GxxExxY protein
MEVHSFLGPGVLESAYQACLAHNLRGRGLNVWEKVRLPVVYDTVRLDHAYEVDMIVNDAVIVELKAITQLHPIHKSQLLSYLVLSGIQVGLLINFHELHLRDGICRVVHRLKE